MKAIKGSKETDFHLVSLTTKKRSATLVFSSPDDVIRKSRDPAHFITQISLPQNSDDSLWLELFVSWNLQI